MLKNLILVASGGAIGSCLRYGLAVLFRSNGNFSSQFPWSTFSVNLIGCLVLGIVVGVVMKSTDDIFNSSLLLFLGIGMMGGFTTFSSFSVDTIKLFQQGYNAIALTYVLSSNLLGIALGYFGLKIAAYL
jgi:CrcB protein